MAEALGYCCGMSIWSTIMNFTIPLGVMSHWVHFPKALIIIYPAKQCLEVCNCRRRSFISCCIEACVPNRRTSLSHPVFSSGYLMWKLLLNVSYVVHALSILSLCYLCFANLYDAWFSTLTLCILSSIGLWFCCHDSVYPLANFCWSSTAFSHFHSMNLTMYVLCLIAQQLSSCGEYEIGDGA